MSRRTARACRRVRERRCCRWWRSAAEADGLTVYRSDPTANAGETAPSELDGLDYALAVSDDEAFNAMLATDLSRYFSRGHVFQLPITDRPAAAFYARVPVLFDDSATHAKLLAQIEAGAEIAVADAVAGADGDTDLLARLGADGMPMFVLTPGKDLHVLAAGDRPPLEAGQELIGLTPRG